MSPFVFYDDWGYPQPPESETLDLRQNVSGGTVGLLTLPESVDTNSGTHNEPAGHVDVQYWFIDKTTHAPDVQRSYSETLVQGISGPTFEDGNNTHWGAGAPLPDQTLGPDRRGYRGMADEPLPQRPPAPDCDDDFDDDTCENK